MYCIIVAMLILLPSPSSGLVDCQVACSRCQRRQEPYPGVLEVYCAMCRECSERRRELRLRQGLDEEPVYNLDDPNECPTPPPCESDPQDPPPYTLSHTIRHKLTTTTTTRRTCPPVTGCQTRMTTPSPPPPPPARPRCYYPCLPACPCPYPPLYATAVSQSLAETATASGDKNTGYMYVYVGVPKDVLRKKIQ